MKSLLTGSKGFLLGYLKNFLPGEYIEYNKNIIDITPEDLEGINTVYHFASPSDKDDYKDPEKMRDMLSGSIKLFDICIDKNIRIVFASSMASIKPENQYGYNKKVLEMYLGGYSNKLILKIPRVYGSCRKKGLIKVLKNGTFTGDKNQKIEFMDIHEWVKETLSLLRYNGVYVYQDTYYKTIKEIEDTYIGNKK